MRLVPGSNDLIKVAIEVKASTPIHAATTARVEMQGITGQRYIELTSEAGDKTPPRRVPDEEYPVLKGNAYQFSKQFLETMSMINEVSKGTAKTMESIRALTDKLKEDPSQVLHPPARKGVEIPK
jgi:ABC-type transporter Mla subunit MlaD